MITFKDILKALHVIISLVLYIVYIDRSPS